MSLVRQSAAHQNPEALAQGCHKWTRHTAILDSQLETTGAYASGGEFSSADIPIGRSVNRWLETPLADRGRIGYIAHQRRGLLTRLLAGMPGSMQNLGVWSGLTIRTR